MPPTRGRPPLPPDQRRSRTLLLSLTESEFQALERAAVALNYGRPGRLVRDLVRQVLEAAQAPRTPESSL